MLVRPVDVHQPFAELRQCCERGWRTVDELLVRSSRGERALEEQLMVLAWFQAVLIEERYQRRAQFRHVEGGPDCAALRAGAQERPVRALAEHEVERADDDRLARAGFAGDGVETGLEFQRQVGDAGQVCDARWGQHGSRLWLSLIATSEFSVADSAGSATLRQNFSGMAFSLTILGSG